MKATEFTSLSDYARKQTEEKRMSIPQTAQMSTMHSNKAKSPRQREPFGPILQLIPLAEQKDYSFFNSMQDYAANSAQDSRDIYDSFDPMNLETSKQPQITKNI